MASLFILITPLRIEGDLECNIENEFESLFIEARLGNNDIIVGEMYRVPNTNEVDSIHRYNSILNKLSNERKEILIVTDQNFD